MASVMRYAYNGQSQVISTTVGYGTRAGADQYLRL